MPEFVIESFEWSVLAFLSIISLAVLVLLIINIRYKRLLTSRKYKIKTDYEFEPLSKKEIFTIQIYNNNLTDARLAGLGYIYKNQTIDYYKTYLKQINYALDGKIMIPSRDSIKVEIDIDSLMTVIKDYNQGKTRVKKLICFVTDSLGVTTTVKAKTIRKVIKNKLKAEKKAQEAAKRAQLKKQEEENLRARNKAAERRMQKRKERWQRWYVWLKEHLPFKNKHSK